ncbi:YjzC family protein [Lentilactobacillus buchneri]|uniref:YjzC family protein n=1 Tax=Lentilactobacillus TaxID=2767893 RepID=UPI0021A4A00F|nr:YjzC family protein [Lentilactobacillus buchneri]MCT3542079.1 YjzC family protein [Lentilactobacillus buchneri]
MKLYEPGTDNVPIGKYLEVGPQGGKLQNPRHATIRVSGHRLPPVSPDTHNKWKHTSGRTA